MDAPPRDTSVEQLDQNGDVALLVNYLAGDTTVHVYFAADGSQVTPGDPASLHLSSIYQAFALYDDGSVATYSASFADGTHIFMGFSDASSGATLTYGPADSFVHGALHETIYSDANGTETKVYGATNADGTANLTSYTVDAGALQVHATATRDTNGVLQSSMTLENADHSGGGALSTAYTGNINGLAELSFSSLVAAGGGNLIGSDSAGLIGSDSAGLKPTEVTPLIGSDSAGLIGSDSAGLIGSDSAGFTFALSQVLAYTASSDPGTSIFDGTHTYDSQGAVSGSSDLGNYLGSLALAFDADAARGASLFSAPTAIDDFSGSSDTTGTLAVGAPVSGVLETLGDRDWFKVHLDAGQHYLFDLKGHDTGDGTLIDPWLRLYDSSGHVVSQNDDGGAGNNARVIVSVDHTGDYFVEASGYHDASSGSYVLSMDETGAVSIDPIAGDNILDTTEQSAFASTGLVVSGSVTDLPPGSTVTLTLEGGAEPLTYSGTVDAEAHWSITVPGDDEAGLAPGGYVAVVGVEDAGGLYAAQTFEYFSVAVVPPTIAIDPVTGDDILDTGEQSLYKAGGLVVTGTTTSAEAGNTVTVTLEGTTKAGGGLIDTFTGTVADDGTWSVTVNGADQAALGLGSQVLLASVTNDAHAQGQTFDDFTVALRLPPSITIDKVAGDNVIDASELPGLASDGLTVSGTSEHVEMGQTVDVAFNGHTYQTTIGADGGWTATIPGADLQDQDLPVGYYHLAATVENAVHTAVHADELVRVGTPTYLFAASAGDGTHFDAELWASDDGSAGSGYLLKDVDPGGVNNNEVGLNGFAFLDDTLYFVAKDPVHGYSLWSSDGTAGGTGFLTDVYTGTSLNDPFQLVNVVTAGGKLYFVASPTSDKSGNFDDYALYVSDGTPGNALRLTDPGSPGQPVPIGDKVFFQGFDATYGWEWWAADGNPADTQVFDINPGSGHGISLLTEIVDVDGVAYFNANDGSDLLLYRSDGTLAGTTVVPGAGATSHLTAFGDKLVFFDATALAVSVTDGTTTRAIETFNADSAYAITDVDGCAFYADGSGKLHATDANLENPEVVASFASQLQSLTAVGQKLFFTADDGVHGRELWVSDGTADGTHMVADINSGGSDGLTTYPGAYDRPFTVFEGKVLFNADDGTGLGLYSSDGETVVRLADLQVTNSGALTDAFVDADAVYFNGYDGTQGGLWRTDGTVAGTYQVTSEPPPNPGGALTTFGRVYPVFVGATNHAPVATDDSSSVAEYARADGNLLANDHDADSDAMTVALVDGSALPVGGVIHGSHGTLTVHADGTFEYRADHAEPLAIGAHLQDAFTYTVSDGHGGTDQATLTETITGVGTGTAAANHLVGNGSRNVLDGKGGNDTLTGGGGGDRFLFDTALNAHTNVDHITRFSHGHDKVELSGHIFHEKVGGHFKAIAINAHTVYAAAHARSAHDHDDRIIYDKSTGALYFDADGIGHKSAVEFAVLNQHPGSINFHDFIMVA